MQIRLITIGKLKEKYWRQACQEYLKRLQHYAKIDLLELAEALPSLSPQQIAAKEATRIQAAIPADTYVIALDIAGEMISSPQLADHLQQRLTYGHSHFTLIIGGSHGLASEIVAQADLSLSFSKLTFPHQLFRVMLLEQLYRACTLMRGESYHK